MKRKIFKIYYLSIFIYEKLKMIFYSMEEEINLNKPLETYKSSNSYDCRQDCNNCFLKNLSTFVSEQINRNINFNKICNLQKIYIELSQREDFFIEIPIEFLLIILFGDNFESLNGLVEQDVIDCLNEITPFRTINEIISTILNISMKEGFSINDFSKTINLNRVLRNFTRKEKIFMLTFTVGECFLILFGKQLEYLNSKIPQKIIINVLMTIRKQKEREEMNLLFEELQKPVNNIFHSSRNSNHFNLKEEKVHSNFKKINSNRESHKSLNLFNSTKKSKFYNEIPTQSSEKK
jgi:hypothetical protein